jgi:hypothetical protein
MIFAPGEEKQDSSRKLKSEQDNYRHKGKHSLLGARETGRQEERKMSDTRFNQGTAKSANPGAAQDDVGNRRKPDWWLISSLILIVISVVGLAYLWK